MQSTGATDVHVVCIEELMMRLPDALHVLQHILERLLAAQGLEGAVQDPAGHDTCALCLQNEMRGTKQKKRLHVSASIQQEAKYYARADTLHVANASHCTKGRKSCSN